MLDLAFTKKINNNNNKYMMLTNRIRGAILKTNTINGRTVDENG